MLQHVVPGAGIAVKVTKTKRHPNGDINAAIGKWKRMLKDSDVINGVKDRQEFIKPSVKKRDQIQKAKYYQKILDANQQ